MKSLRSQAKVLGLVFVVAVLLVLAACQGAPPPTPSATATPKATTSATPTASATPSTTAAAAPITLTCAISYPPNHMTSMPFRTYFLPRLKELTKGQLEVKLYEGASLVSAAEEFKAVARGTVDMAAHDTDTYHSGEVPAWQFTFLPYAIDSDNIPQMRSEVLTIINDQVMKPLNVKIFGMGGFTPMAIYTKKPTNTLEDLKGLKIRGGGGLASQTVANLGAADVSMASTEVYMALSTGVIDGAYWSWGSIQSNKAYEILKYVTFPAMAPGINWHEINLAKFNSLPKNLQDAIVQAGADADAQLSKDLFQIILDGQKTLKQNGLNFIMLSDSELGRWKKAEQPARDWYLKQAGDVGKALVATVDKYPYTGKFYQRIIDALK